MFLKVVKLQIPHGLEITVVEKTLKVKNSKVGFFVEMHSAFAVKISNKGSLFLYFCSRFVVRAKYKKRNFRQLSPLLMTLERKIMHVLFGLSAGFTRQLALVGVGYRAENLKNSLLLKLGFSHEVILDVPLGVKVFLMKDTLLIMQSYSKGLVGSFISEVQKSKMPDVYKNKGVLRIEDVLQKKKVKKK
jgi:large subunit ribosomal protein L6